MNCIFRMSCIAIIHISPNLHAKIQFEEYLKPINWMNIFGERVTETMQNSEQLMNKLQEIFKEFQENVIAYFMHDVHEAQLVTDNSVSDPIYSNEIRQPSSINLFHNLQVYLAWLCSWRLRERSRMNNPKLWAVLWHVTTATPSVLRRPVKGSLLWESNRWYTSVGLW